MRRLLGASSLLLLALAGCGSTATEGDTSAGGVAAAGNEAVTVQAGSDVVLGAGCTNPAGFSVAFPEEWSVNGGGVLPACSWFDPEPFVVPEASDVRTAITFSVGSDVVPAWPDEVGRSTVEIGGWEAVRVEQVTTAGLYPAGTPIVTYAVDLGQGQSLLAETVGLPGEDHERNVEVLDAMMASLGLSGTGRV